MGKYVRRFMSVSAYTQARENDYLEPWVSATDGDGNGRVDYNKTEEEKLLGTPLTFEILSNGNICWCTIGQTVYTKTIEYSLNGGEWTPITSTVNGVYIPVVSGDTIQFRGNNSTYGYDMPSRFTKTSCRFKASGNIMSLIHPTNFANMTEFPSGENNFNLMFLSCSTLVDVSQLILPAETLTTGCYKRMFAYCTSLTETPKLPATEMAVSAYSGMFYLCTSLTKAPELPATTLADSCYREMFYSCTTLEVAPELPAATLAASCYRQMFFGCNNLNYIKCLATNISASSCTSLWTYGVASTGTFVKPSSTDWSSKTGDNGIPANWTVQNSDG